ncbi:signal transducer and activator of transcription 6 isoform X2 [Synchiropus splendidus]|nr:signal transducer and activator of transcription 6 isoform X2 [Synchiropus splendidus]XP_053704518.1 signal transducer and activator of transcription 6 isoform X2 [Synchiropus splendidus]XP_053704519.1 signal transducer and activator of transcription 6 isoform X2 [Synchiropus splendidus]XP_053704520.1 signal transducer and activator of transcription 6 isoform X2 [Synchiropus splendidus]
MAQWTHISKLIQHLPDHVVNKLYPADRFPIEVRHFLADWIEKQRWDDYTVDNAEQEPKARALLDEIIFSLQSISQQNTNVVDRMKLMQISRNLAVFQQRPLHFAVIVRETLQKEREVLQEASLLPLPPSYQPPESIFSSSQDVDQLVAKVHEVQYLRQKMHQMQEDLNWDRQNYESLQAAAMQPGRLDPVSPQVQSLQNHIQQLQNNVDTFSGKRFQLLQESVDALDQCQSRFLGMLKVWHWEQYKATIGQPFTDNLHELQNRCEQLLDVNVKLRQELMLISKPIPEVQERLTRLLKVLTQSSLVVEKQPPQVIKTQSKFSTTVRYLLGEKMAPGKPVVLKAQIINELQAKNLGGAASGNDNVEGLINNTAILEHNTATKSTCATFRNMYIKKIKRADRKGSESVTEEKFALLFSSEISITGCDTPCRIQMISLPLVVIVHGSQENNALATIIWDCAFCEADRVSFVVPERVPWRQMCSTLNSKFTSEVQTLRLLDDFNLHFLAQKIFDKPDFNGDFSNMMVSWSQFNKEVLPGRLFTFWQWFEGVLELTKKHLKNYWSDGLIFGFIGKQHLHLILNDRPNGTFLLRFSDSEIGGITIAYVSASESKRSRLRCDASTAIHSACLSAGGRMIQNIQPFSKRDLDIRSLGDRIRDIKEITHLYPEFHKNDVFRRYYSEPQQVRRGGYIPVSLATIVGTSVCLCQAQEKPTPPGFVFCVCRNDSEHDPNVAAPLDASTSSLGFQSHQFQPAFSPQPMLSKEQMEPSLMPTVDFNANPSMDFPDLTPVTNMDLENLLTEAETGSFLGATADF